MPLLSDADYYYVAIRAATYLLRRQRHIRHIDYAADLRLRYYLLALIFAATVTLPITRADYGALAFS